jgi:hypothetical protein
VSPTFRAKARRFVVSPLAAFVILIAFLVVGSYMRQRAGDKQTRTAQIASCERGNDSRAESNRRIGAHREQDAVIALFLRTAREARLEQWRRDHNRSDLDAAGKYGLALRRLERIRFRSAPLIDCDWAIDHPRSAPRPLR